MMCYTHPAFVQFRIVYGYEHHRKKGLSKEWVLLPLPQGGKPARIARFCEAVFFRYSADKARQYASTLFDCLLGRLTVKKGQGGASLRDAQKAADRVAQQLGFELVEVSLQKEPDGMALCIYVDKDGGITLDDCERFHKAVQPLLDDILYDYLEVSSPGADRPIKTQRDFEKHRGEPVEINLYSKLDGVKRFIGTLDAMNDTEVTITEEGSGARTFLRKAVALIKPVVSVEDEEE